MPAVQGNPVWQQSMIRIKDAQKSLDFYQNLLGMRLLDKYDFPKFSFSLYFLATVPQDVVTPEPGTEEAHQFLWNYRGATIELTYNHGSETDDSVKYHVGNEKGDGFGHLAVTCPDVYAACDELEAKGVQFKKKPDEGNMKGLAFAYDPDGYWIEIIKRPLDNGLPGFVLAQTMLRVKDPKKSVEFYCEKFGMALLNRLHFPQWKFSLYFLGTLEDGEVAPTEDKFQTPDATQFVNSRRQPVLELTHNHGSEDDESFSHFNGNEDGRKGFGHVGFTVDNAEEFQERLLADGVEFQKKTQDGGMKGIAFAKDPDGYWVEIVPRNAQDLMKAQGLV